jgi:hypothetical protein
MAGRPTRDGGKQQDERCPESVVPTQPGVQFILWEDVFVIIDDGDGQPSDYEALRRKFLEQGSRYKAGAGCLTIVPVDAKPPSQSARTYIAVIWKRRSSGSCRTWRAGPSVSKKRTKQSLRFVPSAKRTPYCPRELPGPRGRPRMDTRLP